MSINYFADTIKYYLLLSMREAGINITGDTHAEIDGAMTDLSSTIAKLAEENRQLAARLDALENADTEISGAQFAAAQGRWGAS